ncbi:1,2-phenylacetyl-CoA epoxidase, subunit E [Roseibaca ekhonensis]|uniref:1,2-phenylacetyl-CoA epoxidase, subunit E n=1 Tax=Roseinatronobacter ekhonensis TaxID=254356 RepID=A0A3B0M677_9RHOB|nr:1,2-phenylacetyl-CoA epoxidase subunit PaaE [Roseibaca ekhonensis]SUZ31565.1 1,2-phenylacetyl-CoA epoxidase, subunit E [Roseibaca ekhonensis]
MSRFHPLTVTDVARDTRDSVVVTLQPQDNDAFRFIQGQYLTFRRGFDGQEVRRSYSICAGLDDGALRVGIKRVEGGAFSTWANTELQAGDVLEAMPPQGKFHIPLVPEERRHYLMFAAGSGITPILSIIRTVLMREPQSRVTLVYANRKIASIMFRGELDDLKDQYLSRLSVLHVLGQDAQEIDLFTGRLDAAKLDKLFTQWIDLKSVHAAFICGPEALMQTIAGSLRDHGLTDDQIRYELFGAAQPGRAAQRAVAISDTKGKTCALSITLDGTTRNLDMPMDGTTVLQAALGADLDAPFSCTAGVCSTCRAKVIDGAAEMAVNHALEDYEVRAGYVLTCQCTPTSDRLVLSYDT